LDYLYHSANLDGDCFFTTALPPFRGQVEIG